ncbi:MAG: sigma-70 family RNA polymerase sigma factor, partial [Cyanobacteria bacterium J06649_11]
LQDALLVIWNKAADPNFKLTSGFYNYLIAVCRNIWFRKKKKKDNNTVTLNALEGFSNEQSFVEALENTERQKLFVEHLNRLDENCRRILKLFFSGKSMQYIANALGIETEHAARNRKYRCQKKLESSILKDTRFRD